MDFENRCLEVSKKPIGHKRRKRENNSFKEFNKSLQMIIQFTDFFPNPERIKLP
jgi:hypothetical protein